MEQKLDNGCPEWEYTLIERPVKAQDRRDYLRGLVDMGR